jgi:NAD(P)-dependent dehydrogenase (short-subunit alcohol dehydrogenase family)
LARERYNVRGKVAFITGASRGIGADSAKRLAARGANVALVDIEAGEVEQRAQEIGPQAAAFTADVTGWAALEHAVAGTVERFGGIDIVMANAGIAPMGSIRGIDPADFERTIEVNLLGVWRTIRTALPHVVERRGYILPAASLAAASHAPLLGHYAATKAAVEAMSNSLRQELWHTGTRVGVAYFGFIETRMVSSGFAHPAMQTMRDSMPGLFRKTAPLSDAGQAIVRGIERRARAIYAPRWVLPMLWARGVLQPLSELSNRNDKIAQAVRMAEDVKVTHDDPDAVAQESAGR